jgi:hypothetical protein
MTSKISTESLQLSPHLEMTQPTSLPKNVKVEDEDQEDIQVVHFGLV